MHTLVGIILTCHPAWSVWAVYFKTRLDLGFYVTSSSSTLLTFICVEGVRGTGFSATVSFDVDLEGQALMCLTTLARLQLSHVAGDKNVEARLC